MFMPDSLSAHEIDEVKPQVLRASGRKQIVIGHEHLGIITAYALTTGTLKIGDIHPYHFTLGERTLQFKSRDDAAVEKTVEKVSKGKEHNHASIPKAAAKSAQLLARLIGANLGQVVLLPYFRNTKRTEEIFYPISFLDKTVNENLGMYVYPWASSASGDSRLHFKKFVTAGCLFGSSIRGVDQCQRSVVFIKHDDSVWKEGDIIKEIVATDDSLYEEMQFRQLAMIASLINACSVSDSEKELDYHLPYFDYVLYGIKLFLKNRITPEALKEFCYVIAERKEKHIKKITEICSVYNIKVNIISPFDNMFTLKSGSPEDFFKAIEAVFPFISGDMARPSEEACVSACLQKLCAENGAEKKHVTLWKAYSGLDDSQAKDVEGLFRLANPIMVAAAAMGTEACQVCSILPATEKQIQVEYQKFSKEIAKGVEVGPNTLSPSVFNLTILDMLPAYSAMNNYNGVTFYSSDPVMDQCIPEIQKHLLQAQRRIAALAALTPLDSLAQGTTAVQARNKLIMSAFNTKNGNGSSSSSSSMSNNNTSSSSSSSLSNTSASSSSSSSLSNTSASSSSSSSLSNTNASSNSSSSLHSNNNADFNGSIFSRRGSSSSELTTSTEETTKLSSSLETKKLSSSLDNPHHSIHSASSMVDIPNKKRPK